jgi:hypothetical protein
MRRKNETRARAATAADALKEAQEDCERASERCIRIRARQLPLKKVTRENGGVT